MRLLHAANKKWGAAQEDVFSYGLFPGNLSSIFVIWEDNFLVPDNWTVWGRARSLDLAAPGQLGPTTDLSPGLGAFSAAEGTDAFPQSWM